MWVVEFESPQVENEVETLIKKGLLTNEDRMIISSWIRQVSLKGPESVRGERPWDNHDDRLRKS